MSLNHSQENKSQPSARPSKATARRRRQANMGRINLSIAPELLDMVDRAAKQDYTTRSDIIRMAILWYLRPQGRELDQADPAVILKTLEHRRARANMKKTMEELNL